MLGAPYLAAGAAIAIMASGIGGYFYGHGAGEDKIKAEDAKDMVAAYAIRDKSEAHLQEISLAAANANTARHDTFREVTREVPKIIDRPVYSNVCVDSAGVGLLTRAAQAANGERSDPGQPTGGPAEAPKPAN